MPKPLRDSHLPATTGSTSSATPAGRDGSGGWPRREWLPLAAIVAIAIVMNVAMGVPDPGEQDSARIVNDALIWQLTGELHGGEYRPKVLPLYLLLTRGMLEAGLSPATILALLTHVGSVIGALTLLPLFILWRKLFSLGVALGGIGVTALLPCFWVGHLYAFPHSWAFFLVCVALCLATRANDSLTPSRWGLDLAALGLAMIAGSLKAE